MHALSIAAPTMADLDELLEFEVVNRPFFERWINARPAVYYSRDGVAGSIEAAQRDAHADSTHQFLVRDGEVLVGRVNLTQVRRAHYHSATLGYRVGQAHNGRGIAKEAVRLVLQRAFGELSLARVEATARPENAGSVRVLEANRFTSYGRSRRSFFLDGAWHDLLHFEAHAQ